MKYHKNQKMKVIREFYKGFTGKIINYETDKAGNIYYILEVLDEGKKTEIRCSEEDIKPTWF